MSYRVNGKNLSVCRLMPRARYSNPDMTEKMKRLRYLHVGPKGTSVVTNVLVARVSLPESEKGHKHSHIIPADALNEIDRPAPESTTMVDLPDGPPAITGPHYLVPDIDTCFPGPDAQMAQFTVNGELLRTLLTAACEVCEDSDKVMTLRICHESSKQKGRGTMLRIDTYRQPGEQEFTAILKEMEYKGNYIPGDAPDGVTVVEKKPVQAGIMMPVSEGRRFRGENE